MGRIKSIQILITVIPRFTRLPWQPKNRVNQNCPYRSHSIDKKIVQKMSKKFLLSFYKTVLCKFFQTRSKNRVIENRVMENRVKRGNTVYISVKFFETLIVLLILD